MRLLLWILIILFSGLLLLVGWGYYETHFSSEAKIGIENIRHAEQVSMGMDTSAVLQKMGTPRTRYMDVDTTLVYTYLSNNGDYLDIEIKFDSNAKVKSVFIPHD